jgi:hypothetical protein
MDGCSMSDSTSMKDALTQREMRQVRLYATLKWRVDLFKHTEFDAYAIDGPARYFPTLKSARTWSRQQVFNEGWHHAHIDKGEWMNDGYEWLFVRDESHHGYEVFDPYVEIPKDDD